MGAAEEAAVAFVGGDGDDAGVQEGSGNGVAGEINALPRV
jgi:hypothetical protein